MQKINLLFILMSAISLMSCHHEHNELAHHHHEAEEQSEEHNHSDEIILHSEDAERFGVKVEEVVPSPFNSTLNVAGTIEYLPENSAVATAPVSGIINLSSGLTIGSRLSQGQRVATIDASAVAGGNQNQAAKVAMESARQEYERITPLYNRGIVSEKEYNAARAAYESAKSAYSPRAGSGAVVSPISGVVGQVYVSQGQYVEAGQAIASISKSDRLMLKAEVPEKYRGQIDNVSTANFRSSHDKAWISLSDIGGKKLASGAGVASSPGYIPVCFSFNNQIGLTPGSFVNVSLIKEVKDNVIAVSSEAISEQQGAYFVYVKLDDEGYEKRLVSLGESNGIQTEILQGLNAGDQVVVEGVTFLKLAEVSGNVPEGHSHNH